MGSLLCRVVGGLSVGRLAGEAADDRIVVKDQVGLLLVVNTTDALGVENSESSDTSLADPVSTIKPDQLDEELPEYRHTVDGFEIFLVDTLVDSNCEDKPADHKVVRANRRQFEVVHLVLTREIPQFVTNELMPSRGNLMLALSFLGHHLRFTLDILSILHIKELGEVHDYSFVVPNGLIYYSIASVKCKYLCLPPCGALGDIVYAMGIALDTAPEKSRSKGLIAWHVVLWLFMLYWFIQLLGFRQSEINNLFISGLYLVQFGVHEVGHMLFMFAPPIVAALAGSVCEVFFPVLIVVAAVRGKSYWALVFGLLWVMMALMSVGNYMADARAQQMMLMGPSPDPIHDWNFIFGKLGWLQADVVLGTITKILGGVVGAAGLLIGLTRIGKK